jgi:hypothetical protein
MGRLLEQAIEQAGLAELARRALSGCGLGPRDIDALRAADVLLVAGLADAVRARHRGDDVRLMSDDDARRAPDVQRLSLVPGGADGATGQELLLEVALARLQTPVERSIAVGWEQLGLQLAQTALAFGADVLFGDLSTRRTLPLLDGPAARREEIRGLCERAGRRVRWASPPPALVERAP